MKLPHSFPFAWIERGGEESVRIVLSTNSFWTRNGAAFPTSFCAEIIAQAAAFLLAKDAHGAGSRWLAGIENLEIERPLLPGDRLDVHVALRARVGALAKVDGELRCDSRLVARGSVIIA